LIKGGLAQPFLSRSQGERRGKSGTGGVLVGYWGKARNIQKKEMGTLSTVSAIRRRERNTRNQKGKKKGGQALLLI